MITFKLEKLTNKLGVEVDTLVKYEDGKKLDIWCDVMELDCLFDTCTRRWPRGWDLEKLVTCINECEFD